MLRFLKAPILPNIDFYETTKLRLTWNIHLLLSFALIPLILIGVFTNSIYTYFYGASLILLLISLLFTKRTGNYRVVSAILCCILYAMILVSMFSIDEYIHYLEPFWALVMILYVYFIHGKTWGAISIIATTVAMCFFFIFMLNATIGNINQLEFHQSLSMGLEISICLGLIGYILHQFIFLKNHAELELRMMNTALRKEKAIVESRDQEKTILLQEIHHRVKNNLQIVMSLLRMQSNKIASPEGKEQFNDAINRVLTMSLIHQKLYESENLSAVDLSEYIESLASDVLRSHQIPRIIDKKFTIEVPEIGMKTIVPIALIITELISNSVKHAFDETENPKIELSVRLGENSDRLELSYSDNGKWKESSRDSFGTQLIEALTEQLDGKCNLNLSNDGSVYTFYFQQLD